jgi:hypothetical protein
MAIYDDAILRRTRQNLANKVNDSVSSLATATIGFDPGQVDRRLAEAAASVEGVTNPDTWIQGIGWGSTPNSPVSVGESVSNAATTVQDTVRQTDTVSQFSYASSTPKQPNPLEEFASFNNIFTLGVLTPEEVNFPGRTYRQNGPTIKILRSGGGLGDSKVTTAFETQGRVEYYIDNLDIDSIIAPKAGIGVTNATTINFQVTEPYSMGLFMQSLMEAALNAGFANYIQAPYILQVDFVGWDDSGNRKIIENTTRYFPLRFIDIKFNVTAGGCVYDVTAIPYNETAFSDTVQRIRTDVAPTGATLQELLQTGQNSLTNIINRRFREQAAAGEVSTPDEIAIIFPDPNLDLSAAINSDSASSATISPEDAARSLGQVDLTRSANIDRIQELQSNTLTSVGRDSITNRIVGLAGSRPNVIGQSRIVQSILERGHSPMGIDAFVLDDTTGNYNRGKISISSDLRQFSFGQGMKIQNIIESVVLTSDYARRIIDFNVDQNGMVDWFKIEADVYINEDLNNEARNGRPGLVYIYKVVPYKVHSSVFSRGSTGGANYNNLSNNVAKEYNYIYTGKNKDILNFDIQMNFAFFTGLQEDRGQGTADIVNGGSDTALSETPTVFGQNEGTGDFQRDGDTPIESVIEGTSQTTPGTELDDQKIRIARQFHDAIVNSDVDLVTLKLDIMGDPYFIADSGQGNYNSPNIGILNINGDGGMEYQNSEVDILINFRTPIDYKDDESGKMLFPEDTLRLTPFSGLYRVLFVRNSWQQNKFVQTLDLIRRPNQEVEGSVTDQSMYRQAQRPIGEVSAELPTAQIQQEVERVQAELSTLGNAVAGYAAGQVDPRLLSAARQLEADATRITNEITNVQSQAQAAINSARDKVNNSLANLARGIRTGF